MQTRILSFDTTSDFGSLALWEGDAVVREILLHTTDGFAQILFEHMQRLLEECGWKLDTIACFAAASGPGSFTGVRVGLTAAKGLADVLGKPVVAVSNLEAMATFGSRDLRAPVLDARRGEIYGAVYDAGGALLQKEVVSKFPQWRDQLPVDIEYISCTPALFAPYTAADGCWTESPRALAGAVAQIAARRLAAGTVVDPLVVDANYVRRSDAELFWKD